jgi:hypothetical protein
VELVGDHNEVVLAGHLGQGRKLLLGEDPTRGVLGVAEEEKAAGVG